MIAFQDKQMAGLVCLPLAQAAMARDEWRAGWLAVGGAVLMVGLLPNLLLMVHAPESLGLHPDQSVSTRHAPQRTRAQRDFTRAQALRTPAFWLLSLFTLFAYPVQAGVSLHQAPYLIEQGLSPATAATIVSTFSLMSGIASFGFGFFPGSVPIRFALALSGLAIAGGAFAMLGIASPRAGFVAATIFGVGIGGLLTMLPIAWADYFGRASYGAIRGIALSVQVLAQAAGLSRSPASASSPRCWRASRDAAAGTL